MPQIKVTIDDRVREELVLVTLDAARAVSDILDKLIEDFGLPQRTLDRQPIWYDLLRLKDDSRLDAARSLAAQGVEQGDTLQLVSKEGRDAWITVRDILEEIRDQLIEEAVDQLTESALDALSGRLERAASTGADPRAVKQLEAKLKAARLKMAGKAASGKTVSSRSTASASAKSGKATSGSSAKSSKAAAGKSAPKPSAQSASAAGKAASEAAKGAAKTAEAGAGSGGGGVVIGCLVLIGLIVGGVVVLGVIGRLVSRREAEPPPPPTQEPVFEPTDVPLFEPTVDPPDVAPGEPVLGTGDVQVTLRWYSEADLDLYVVDPSGDQIYFQQPTSPSGGTLDVDSNRDCSFATTSPVENVYWPPGGAPSGRYTVYVNYFATCGGGTGPQTYELTVLVDGQVWEVYSYTIEEYDSHEVVTFSY